MQRRSPVEKTQKMVNYGIFFLRGAALFLENGFENQPNFPKKKTQRASLRIKCPLPDPHAGRCGEGG
ncbi:MAG: hypothetical protein C6W56_12975 [Caldibacillus debilis]|nr:hypothetical protein [Bacillaceae bacterium]REJ25927.1 MAG: hypothetical protein C6W56_12975 [Caldibacillus debilis]